jgi:hypothetical protein
VSKAKLWAIVEAVRKASARYGISHSRAKRILSRYATRDLVSFRRELEDRVLDLANWDQWAVGCHLDGHISPDFASSYFLWVVMQGEEFYRLVLRDPRRAVERAPAEDPYSIFYFDCLTDVLGNIVESRSGETPPGLGEMKLEKLSGKAWKWEDLRDIHPDLWEKYFINRDRRQPHPPRKRIDDYGFISYAAEPVIHWVDIYDGAKYLLAQHGTLNRDQVCLQAVLWCHIETQNGGMSQFFGNSTGVVAPEALEGFKRFGAKAHHRDLGRIMKEFPWKNTLRDRRARQVQLQKRWPERTIDDEFSGSRLPDLEPILVQYIKTHPLSFFRSP